MRGKTYRVEGHIPEAPEEDAAKELGENGTLANRSTDKSPVFAKAERRRNIVRRLANDARYNRADNEDTKPNSSTSLGLNGVSNSDTKNHSTKVSKVPDKESRLSDLASNISPTIEGRGEGAFAKDDKH